MSEPIAAEQKPTNARFVVLAYLCAMSTTGHDNPHWHFVPPE